MENGTTNLPRLVFLFTPQHADRDVQIVFDVGSGLHDKRGLQDEPGDVFFNGQLLGQVVARERLEHSVTVPVTLWNRDRRAKLEVRFPQAVPKRAYKRPRFEAWRAWALWKIRTQYTPVDSA